jgi:hypothetical protein
MALTASLSLCRYMTIVTEVAVTPDQVAPPLDPPAHSATHGGCSSSPVTQNGRPVVVPLAGGATPTRPATDPLPAPEPATGVVPVPPTTAPPG